MNPVTRVSARCGIFIIWMLFGQALSPVHAEPDSPLGVQTVPQQTAPASDEAAQKAETDAPTTFGDHGRPHPEIVGPPPPPQPVKDSAAMQKARADLKAIQVEVERVDAALERDTISVDALMELRQELEQISAAAKQLISDTTPEVKAAETRLKQLGEAPAEGQATEAAALTEERQRQAAQFSELQNIVKQTRLIEVRVDQAVAHISERRRDQLTSAIFERQRSALDPALWADFMKSLPRVFRGIWLLWSDWMANLRTADNVRGAWQALIIVGLAVACSVVLRRFIVRFSGRNAKILAPSQLTRTMRAGWTALLVTVLPTFAIGLVYAAVNELTVIPARVEAVMFSALSALPPLFLTIGVALALLAPNRPNWRLIDMPTPLAHLLTWVAIVSVLVFRLGITATSVGETLFSPAAFGYGIDMISSLTVAALYAVGLRAIAANMPDLTSDDAKYRMARWRWARLVVWFLIFAIPVAQLLGYRALAHFIAYQLVGGVTALALLYLLLAIVEDGLSIGLRQENRFTDFLLNSLTMRQRTIDQLGVVLSGVLRILLIILTISFLLVPLGVESRDLVGSVQRAFFGFQIGDITISLSSILLAVGIFLLGIFITRSIQRWLEYRLLPQTRLDVGVRNSVRTAFGYVGISMAAIFGFSYMGLDLSNLAIVAGALSVGIGFGLQSVVNNFVSGLILLVERPVKAGDWIVAGGNEGYVKKISVRSTEIETFDLATVIIPNSDLISGVVTNWMHTNHIGRVRVPVNVAYDSDPDQVCQLLLACAAEHPDVVTDPASVALFMNFGEHALMFELRVYISNVDNMMVVGSDLRRAVFARLKEAGVKIPLPQQDVHFRDIDRFAEIMGGKKTAAGGRALQGPEEAI